MDKHHNNSLILIFISIIVIGIISVGFWVKPSKVASDTPSVPIVEAQTSELTSVGSPDGQLTLTMKKEKIQDGFVYTFFTIDSVGRIQKTIFTKTVSLGDIISIPTNTFSPDDKYLFLKEENLGQTDYFAVTPAGTLDISGPFLLKYPNLKITDVTGWGGMTLIVVNTDKEDGSLGPSFWFDVSGKSFIQLSTRFN